MADATELALTAETKKVINPRVEIDTSPPFESVKEAVDHFGGGGPWMPHHLLRLAAHHHGTEVFDMDKVEKQAEQLERDLIMKEQETLHVLKELEAAKRFVEGLKLNIVQEMSAFMASPEMKPDGQSSAERLSLCPVVSPGLISMELNQAKMNLNKTTTNLAVIRASVESLNNKMRGEKVLLERSSEREITNSAKLMSADEDYTKYRAIPEEDYNLQTPMTPESSRDILKGVKEVNFEAEQFKKMTEASRYEVMKAMSEIEQTKTSIKMAEMRLTAARKMEEAAKAVEAIALEERNALLDAKNSPLMFLHKPGGITLSIEEYNSLTHKAQQAEEFCKIKYVDTNAVCQTDRTNQSELTFQKKLEATTKETRRSKKSLQEALGNEDVCDRRKLGLDDECNRETSEQDHTGYSGHNSAKFRFRNSHRSSGQRGSQPLDGNESNVIKDKAMPVYRSTISIGDILSRKLILQDDIVVGKHVESHAERQEVSLSQMLREQSGLLLHPTKSVKDGNGDKQFYTQRKKFGFIHVTIPRQSKKKAQVS